MLTFEPVRHRYELDGAQVPSVTGVLHRSGIINFDGIPAPILDAAKARGTAVHSAIHYYNEQDLDAEQFAQDFPEWQGYLEAWIGFCSQRKFEAVFNERRVASRRYQLAGTIDSLGLLDGSAVLLDFATGRPHDVAKNLQTAAYYQLALEWGATVDTALGLFFNRYPVVRRYAVQLKKNGTFRLDAYNDPSDFRRFNVLLEAQRIVDAHRGERDSYAEVA